MKSILDNNCSSGCSVSDKLDSPDTRKSKVPDDLCVCIFKQFKCLIALLGVRTTSTKAQQRDIHLRDFKFPKSVFDGERIDYEQDEASSD